jgi:hypothetical protein
LFDCHGQAHLEAQEHGDVVAGTALARLLAAHDGIHQADADLEASGHFGLAQALLVKPLLGLRWGVGWGFHGAEWVLVGGGKLGVLEIQGEFNGCVLMPKMWKPFF